MNDSIKLMSVGLTAHPQQHVDAPIAGAHSRLADVLDPVFKGGLVAALRLVDIERAIDAEG